MDYKKVLSSLNEQIKNWDFKQEQSREYFRVLVERNMLIVEQTPILDFCPDCETPSINTCYIGRPQGNPEHLAFHVGAPHQKRLYALQDDKIKNRFTIGVFFSLDPKDVIFFSEGSETQELMVYFLDSATAKGARVQTNYSSSVISRYDLDDFFTEGNSVEDRDFLRTKWQKLNDKWVAENTAPFNIDEISELKQKFYEWLIVPDPVNVQY
jgi:hypothetical protein